MTIQQLKLDVLFWWDAKSGKKNFEIRKNDRDFALDDILKLKAYKNGHYVRWNKNKNKWVNTTARKADTITEKVTEFVTKDEFNEAIPEDCCWGNISKPDVLDVLNNYFDRDTLPAGFVVLGTKVMKIGRKKTMSKTKLNEDQQTYQWLEQENR